MFCKLVQNEWMKLFNRIGTYVMIGLLFFGALATVLFTYDDAKASGDLPGEAQWHAELEKQNENLAENEDHFNHYVSQHAINQQAINNYRMENNLSPYEKANVWGYMDTNGVLVQLIGVFVIIVGASIVANEFQKGTIKLLLVRSASRTQILASKFTVTVLFGLFLLLLLFVLSFGIGGLFFGFDGAS